MMTIRLLTVCVAFATLACSSAEGPAAITDPHDLGPNLTILGCPEAECSMPAQLDPNGLTATVWWSLKTMKGNATMAFFGNYGRVEITANAGGLSSTAQYELGQTQLPYAQFYEVSTQKLTDKSCGQSVTGTGQFRAETRLISSGLTLHSEGATIDAEPATQIPCLGGNGGGADGGGGNASPGVQYVPYTCYWTDYFVGAVLVSHIEWGCWLD
jgi:hypothetical protein